MKINLGMQTSNALHSVVPTSNCLSYCNLYGTFVLLALGHGLYQT
jgi:hypothetical protein